MESTVTRVIYLNTANIWRSKEQMQQNKVKNILFSFECTETPWERNQSGLAEKDMACRSWWILIFFMAVKCIDSAHRTISLRSFYLYMCGAWCFQKFLKMEFCLCLRLRSWGKVQVESLADHVIFLVQHSDCLTEYMQV